MTTNSNFKPLANLHRLKTQKNHEMSIITTVIIIINSQKSTSNVEICLGKEEKLEKSAINNNGWWLRDDEWGKGRRKIGNKNFVNFFTRSHELQ
jgi:predicted nucleic acid binding AN1-type Zn finger protein